MACSRFDLNILVFIGPDTKFPLPESQIVAQTTQSGPRAAVVCYLSSVATLLSSRSVPPPSDAPEDLHVAITSNSPGWQQRAFEAFHGLVHGLLIKALGPRAEISDLTGDVFVNFFANAHRIHTPLAVRSYLVSITMNVARREVRMRKRRELFQLFM